MPDTPVLSPDDLLKKYGFAPIEDPDSLLAKYGFIKSEEPKKEVKDTRVRASFGQGVGDVGQQRVGGLEIAAGNMAYDLGKKKKIDRVAIDINQGRSIESQSGSYDSDILRYQQKLGELDKENESLTKEFNKVSKPKMSMGMGGLSLPNTEFIYDDVKKNLDAWGNKPKWDEYQAKRKELLDNISKSEILKSEGEGKTPFQLKESILNQSEKLSPAQKLIDTGERNRNESIARQQGRKGVMYDLGKASVDIGAAAATVATNFIPVVGPFVSRGIGTAYAVGQGFSTMGDAMAAYDDYHKQNNIPIDPAERYVASATAGIAEAGIELAGLEAWIPKGFMAKQITSKMIGIGKDASKKLIVDFAEKAPKYGKQILRDAVKGGIVEGPLEEGTTSIVQILAQNGYKNPEDQTGFWEGMKQTLIQSAYGFAMGSFLGPAASFQMTMEQKRSRDARGAVTLGRNTETGETLEITGQDKDGATHTYTRDGVHRTIDKNSLEGIIDVPLKDWERIVKDLPGKREEALNAETEVYQKDADRRITSTVQAALRPDGTIIEATVGEGENQQPLWVIGGDINSDKVVSVLDQEGRKWQVGTSMLKNIQQVPAGQYAEGLRNNEYTRIGAEQLVKGIQTGVVTPPSPNEVVPMMGQTWDLGGKEVKIASEPEDGKYKVIYEEDGAELVDYVTPDQLKPMEVAKEEQKQAEIAQKEIEKTIAPGVNEEEVGKVEGAPTGMVYTLPAKGAKNVELPSVPISNEENQIAKVFNSKPVATLAALKKKYPKRTWKIVDQTDQTDPDAEARYIIIGKSTIKPNVEAPVKENLTEPTISNETQEVQGPSAQEVVPTTDKKEEKLSNVGGISPTVANFTQNPQNEVSEQLPRAEFQAEDRKDQGVEEISRRLEAGNAASKEQGVAGQRDGEARIALDYAKENNLWIKDLYSLGEPFSTGNESTNAVSKDGYVYKSNNLANTQTISGLLKQVEIHNQLFPETKLDFVGFTGIDNGDKRPPFVEVIFKQQLIDDSEPASQEEIDQFMQDNGFTKSGRGAYSNGKYFVSDLFPRNVLKDKDGDIFVVDNIIREQPVTPTKEPSAAVPQQPSQPKPDQTATKPTSAGEAIFTPKQKKLLNSVGKTIEGTTGVPLEPEPGTDDHRRWVSEHGTNPDDIAIAYQEELGNIPINKMPEWQQDLIQACKTRVSKTSFARFGDPNWVGKSIVLNWFTKDPKDRNGAIDDLAQYYSDEYHVEITPEDIVEFIRDHPSRYARKTTDLQKNLERRYKQVTGNSVKDHKFGSDLTTNEQEAAVRLEHWLMDAIDENGITSLSILESLKSDLFEGFPYENEAYESIKRYLQANNGNTQAVENNGENTGSGIESQGVGEEEDLSFNPEDFAGEVTLSELGIPEDQEKYPDLTTFQRDEVEKQTKELDQKIANKKAQLVESKGKLKSKKAELEGRKTDQADIFTPKPADFVGKKVFDVKEDYSKQTILDAIRDIDGEIATYARELQDLLLRKDKIIEDIFNSAKAQGSLFDENVLNEPGSSYTDRKLSELTDLTNNVFRDRKMLINNPVERAKTVEDLRTLWKEIFGSDVSQKNAEHIIDRAIGTAPRFVGSIVHKEKVPEIRWDILQDTFLAYGSEEAEREAIEKTVMEVESRLIASPAGNDYSGRRGIGVHKILPRTVLDGFKESGYVDFVGIKVNSPQDIADLWNIHRSPYIEKFHVVFLKGNEIVGSRAITSNRLGSAFAFPVSDIISWGKVFQADGCYFLHNHPNGNHKSSYADRWFTIDMAIKLKDDIKVHGHIIIDHDKFSLLTPKSVDQIPFDWFTTTNMTPKFLADYKVDDMELDYKNAPPRLFTERERLPSGGAAPERMIEIGKAILTDRGYNGAVFFLSPGLDINAYDIIPLGATDMAVLEIAYKGVMDNLGSNYIIVHDGSYNFGNMPMPDNGLDIINTKTGESESINSLVRPDPTIYDSSILWEPKGQYGKQDAEIDRVQNLSDGEFAEDYRDFIPSMRAVENKWIDKYLLRWVQDANISLKRMMQEFSSRGVNIDSAHNPYDQQNRTSGSNRTQMEEFYDKYEVPVMEIFGQIKSENGVEFHEIESYLKAKHGIERNQKQNEGEKKPKIWGGIPKAMLIERGLNPDGSNAKEISDSITYEELMDYLKGTVSDTESRMGELNTEELWRRIHAATQFTLDRWWKDGFISLEQYLELTGPNGYKNYVPLRGWKGDTADLVFDYLNNEVGGAFNPNKKAFGRKSEADDTVPYIFSMAGTAIVSGNKNNTKRLLLDIARQHPELSDLVRVMYTYEVKQPDGTWINVGTDKPDAELFKNKEARINKDTSLRNRNTTGNAAQHEVEVFENGQRYTILTDPKVASAMNGDNLRELGDIGRTIGGFTRFWAAWTTSKNPAFIVPNMARDFRFAMRGMFVENNLKMTGQFVGNYKDAHRAIMRQLQGKQAKSQTQQKIDQMYHDFRTFGGITGYTRLDDINRQKKKIEREAKWLMREMDNKGKWTPQTAVLWGRRLFKLEDQLTSHLSEWSENIARFATYMTYVENGYSKAESATKAKEATTNFDRKGSWSSSINSAWAFFNARVQGIKRYADLWQKNPAKMAAFSAMDVALGFALASLMDNWFDDGEDEEGVKKYDKVNPFVRRNYLNVPVPGSNKLISIPNPHGFAFFHALGFTLYDVMTGRTTPQKAIGISMDNFTNNLLPVDLGSSFNTKGQFTGRPFVPTFIVPIYDLWLNEDFAGRYIFREPFTKDMEERLSDSQMYKYGTNPAIVKATDMLFKATGGNVEKGLAYYFEDGQKKHAWGSVNPSSVEHLLEGYLSGKGQFYNQAYKLARRAIKPEPEDKPIQTYDIPVVNRFVRSAWGDPIKDEYYKNRKEASDILYEYKQGKKVGKDEAVRVKQEIGVEKFNQAVKINDYQKKIDEVNEDLNSPKLTQQRKDQLMKRKRELMKKINDLDK